MRIWDGELLAVNKPLYVTEGLLLWLDGINNTRSGHDSSSTTWEDLSGNNYDFTSQNGNAIWGEDHCAFDGNFYFEGAYAFNNAWTVEVCYKSNNTQLCIFVSGGNVAPGASVPGSPGVYERGGQITLSRNDGRGAQMTAYYNKPSGLIYISFSDKSAPTINGIQRSSNPNNNLIETTETKSRIGNRLYSNTSYRKAFDLYAVRLYNRVLSAEEIAQNYAADLLRFGAGGV